MLGIFIGVAIAIFAYKTSDISSLRDQIFALNSTPKTTTNSDLTTSINELATQITALNNLAAKSTEIQTLATQITALQNSMARTTAITDLRNQIIALEASTAKTTSINELAIQINALDKCLAELKGICGTHTQMLMNLNGKEKQVAEEDKRAF